MSLVMLPVPFATYIPRLIIALYVSFVVVVVLPSLFGGAAATLANEFTIVVVKEQASELLRTTPEGAVLHLPPYLVQLSSNWTVVDGSVWVGRSVRRSDVEGQLLHCRLPLPRKAETLKLLEENFKRLYGLRIRGAIWHWLKSSTQMNDCLFGDGEGLLTGVSEWYILCPRGEVRKVNRTAIVALYGNSSLDLQKMIGRLMTRRSLSGRMERGNGLDKWTTLIGEYRRHTSEPRWNGQRRAWEMIYPTDRECDAWREDASVHGGGVPEELRKTKKHRDEGAPTETWGYGGEVWETVVRFHCEPQKRGRHRVQEWSITEVRQACLHEVLLPSPVVCEWEETMGNLRVNPIPCIPV